MKDLQKVFGNPALRNQYEWACTDSTAPAGEVSSTGALDAGTTPVFSMSGPGGPPVTYDLQGPIGATGPGVDPLQSSGDPWGH